MTTIDEKLDLIIKLVTPAQREVIVSCAEAARLIGVSKQTISTYIREGRLHKTTIGHSTGIRLSEITKHTNPL